MIGPSVVLEGLDGNSGPVGGDKEANTAHCSAHKFCGQRKEKIKVFIGKQNWSQIIFLKMYKTSTGGGYKQKKTKEI